MRPLNRSFLKTPFIRHINRSAREDQFDPANGRLSGVTPFSFAAGVLPVIFDEQISVNFLTGSFGSEVGLIVDAAERSGSYSLAGTENITAQAVLYAASPEPLIGEELYAAGAYLQVGSVHQASVLAQDIFRWLIILALLLGAALKMAGVW